MTVTSSPGSMRQRNSRSDEELLTRIEAEFREMPGMMLTIPQACRLFSLEPGRCADLMSSLVHTGELATDGQVFGSRRDWQYHA